MNKCLGEIFSNSEVMYLIVGDNEVLDLVIEWFPQS